MFMCVWIYIYMYIYIYSFLMPSFYTLLISYKGKIMLGVSPDIEGGVIGMCIEV